MRNSCIIGLLVGLLLSTQSIAQQPNPQTLAKEVGIDQKLNAPVPLDLTFRAEDGQLVPLRQFFGERPVVLALVYYRCPSLCSLILNGVVQSMSQISFDPGKQYEVVVISFDPTETPELAKAKKAAYAKTFGKPSFSAGWHFLTGSPESIRQLTSAVGFRYRWDDAGKQFIHASGILVATPAGSVSKYFYGVHYLPRDLRLALVEASKNKIGSPVDQFLLFCLHYDPTKGKYGLVIMNVIRLLGALTVLGLAIFIIGSLLRDRHKKHRESWEARRVV